MISCSTSLTHCETNAHYYCNLQVAESAAVLIGSTESGAVALEAMHLVRGVCLHALICYLVGSDVLTAYPELLQDFMQLQVHALQRSFNGFCNSLSPFS